MKRIEMRHPDLDGRTRRVPAQAEGQYQLAGWETVEDPQPPEASAPAPAPDKPRRSRTTKED